MDRPYEMTDAFLREKDIETEERRHCEERGRDKSYAATSQRIPRTQKLEDTMKSSLLEPSETAECTETLISDF